MDFIQQLRAFDESTVGNLTPNAIVVYFRLFMMNNRNHWEEWFETTDTMISLLTGIKRRESILSNLNLLKQKGYIDFVRGGYNKPSKYKIMPLVTSGLDSGFPSSFTSGFTSGITSGSPSGFTSCFPSGFPSGIIKRNKTEKEKENILPSDDGIPYAEILDHYSRLCPSFQKPTKMTDGRRRAIRGRWTDLGKSFDALDDFLRKCEASDFLTGRSGKWAGARGVDWIFKQANFVKILDGNYDNRDTASNQNMSQREKTEEEKRRDEEENARLAAAACAYWAKQDGAMRNASSGKH